MKVMFATYPMAFHTPGGGEVQLLAYKKHLPAFGVEVSLFDPWNPRFKEYDIIHYFSCVGGSVHFCRFIKQLNIPLVISSSLWITEETKHLYPVDEIRTQLDLADRIVANSDIECQKLSEVLTLPREKFVAVPNGIDELFIERPGPELFREFFNLNDPFILNVGNIEPRKNQLRLAQAMQSFPDYKLVLIGHIRDETYFHETVAVAPKQIFYAGYIQHDSVLLRSAYQACRIFVLPSTLETPGLAALEAAAQGAQLILTEEGCTREYFNTCAQYINPCKVESISECINLCLTVDLNYKTIFDAEKYLWINVTNNLMKAYTQLLDNFSY